MARKKIAHRAKQRAKPTQKGWRYSRQAIFAAVLVVIGFVAIFVASSPPEGQIIGKASGKCLDNFYNRQVDSNYISIHTCTTDNPAQTWTLPGDQTIRTKEGFCLDVMWGSKIPRSPVWLFKCTNDENPSQKWRVRSNGTIINPASGLCLEVADFQTASHSRLWLNDCNENSSQVWAVPKTIVTWPASSPTTPPTSPAPGTDTPYNKLTPGTSWQWQLGDSVDENVLGNVKNSKKMFDVDMENTEAGVIARLKAKGIEVICSIKTGAWESTRIDAADFPAEVRGSSLNGRPDELYLDIRSQAVRDLMAKRMDKAKAKGCGGIEPDVDDAYFKNFNGNYGAVSTVTGFPIAYQDQVSFNTAMASAAHARGMSYGLKNGADAKFVQDMLPHIDWVLNEQCFEFNRCGVYAQVIAAGKAVFQVEYNLNASQFCTQANTLNFDSLKKASALSALPRTACRNG